MDNLTHTLIGAALAESGLRRRTRYAAAAMMIGANIPDVDVIAVPLGHAVEWRRGITHGIPALIVWPFLLTGLILLWHHRVGSRRRQRGLTASARGPADRPPVRRRELLLLSAIAVLTHPTYDWLNNYGMRWLMPFDGRWSYGDSMFIIDPYLLIILILGVGVARRRARAGHLRPFTPARAAVAAAAVHTVTLVALHEIAERAAVRRAGPEIAGRRFEVSPLPANPFRWRVILDDGAHYRRGVLHLVPRQRVVWDDNVPVQADEPWARAAAASPAATGFLDWSRWPFYRKDQSAGKVRIGDLRYAGPGATGWASIGVAAGR